SGRFHAYGQDLIVRKGELQFAGPPDQPYVNLEAIRNPDATEDGVTAGLRVTGLADEPKAEVFSDPAMSQQEALSYLLRGQGLGSDGDSNALTSALVGLGVAQSGQVVGKIGETFGVSNLAVDTAGVGDSQQVQVSGYVLPGLQVKYGVGIFDSLATLTLRYRLMPKLYLEAVSGVDQALDLLYQFEF
ncbi:MAG: translocation/assembly module TamB domain-containing protein, partial [Pantoea agglomerans]